MEIRPIISTLLRSRTGPLLVALQVAISLAILANAVFVVQQRISASQRPSGIADEENVGYVSVRPLQPRTHIDSLAEQVRERNVIANVPGVKSVAWAMQMPMSRSGNSTSIRLKADQPRELATPAFYFAQPGFASTLGLKIIEGRDFNESDVVEVDIQTAKPGEGQPDGAIVTKARRQAALPGRDELRGQGVPLRRAGKQNPPASSA
jgi:putative ABC transport system permease protein